ncbi:MAG: murein biosynthesis integral membrane protein MurJ, partial [Halanaerobiales bacterium]
MKKTAILLMVLTIVSKFVGFGREITLSYFYGASATSDAYLISLTIPQTIFAFIGAAIATCFIPMYSGIKKNLGPRQANRFTNNLTNITLILCTGFFI